ncbi:MAG: prephenate dehydratase, partial [Lentisphaeria bacterium]|nr:prephenate dehydratase [Lentisphaeria bacterium]
PLGTFTSEAASKKFGHSAVLHPVNSIAGIFREVEAGRADYGCVPVENTTEGVVNPTLDALRDTSLKIVAELNLPIHHQLLGNAKMEQIHCIYSHPQALAQCRAYLDANFPDVSRIEVTSTSRAAELAAHEQGAAAIAGKAAATLFQLNILAENIEDVPGNTTRFLIIADQETEPTGEDRTSICFILKDRAGALFDALTPLQEAGVSMSLIESRPLPSSRWEYCFFVDLLGHRKDPVIQKALAELEERCTTLKIFGSYPRARR